MKQFKAHTRKLFLPPGVLGIPPPEVIFITFSFYVLYFDSLPSFIPYLVANQSLPKCSDEGKTRCRSLVEKSVLWNQTVHMA